MSVSIFHLPLPKADGSLEPTFGHRPFAEAKAMGQPGENLDVGIGTIGPDAFDPPLHGAYQAMPSAVPTQLYVGGSFPVTSDNPVYSMMTAAG